MSGVWHIGCDIEYRTPLPNSFSRPNRSIQPGAPASSECGFSAPLEDFVSVSVSVHDHVYVYVGRSFPLFWPEPLVVTRLTTHTARSLDSALTTPAQPGEILRD